MHAYLLVGQNKELLEKRVLELAQKLAHDSVVKTLAKIEDSREIFRFTSLGFSQKTAVIIYDIGEASIPAQNAFLKPLEEPQKNIIYLLTATSADNVIPTITSRVEIINLNSPKVKNDSQKDVGDFLESKIGDQLKVIVKIKDRVKALEFLNNVIEISQPNLAKNNSTLNIVEQAEKSRRAIKANGNIAIHLTKFIVNIN